MAYVWLYCIFILKTLYVLAAEQSCKKTLGLCKLERGDDTPFKLPTKGPKGENGDLGYLGAPGNPGPKGQPGTDGRQGSDGNPGVRGSEGPSGSKGNRGDSGTPGDPGALGTPGSKGELGDPGLEGFVGLPGLPAANGMKGMEGPPGPEGPMGKKAERGEKGTPGPIGAPGIPGEPGVCGCGSSTTVTTTTAATTDSNSDESSEGLLSLDDMLFGKEDTPSNQVCKFSNAPVDNETYYYLGPGPMVVKCITRQKLTTLTCIPPKISSVIDLDEEQHWLSQKNLTIKDMYGINRTQIEWLQKNSVSTFQTIRYHCLNTNVFPRDRVENSMLLLSWNDNTIGPMPTLTKPFFYSVENDGCSNATDNEWSYTDITLVSESIRRVPVIDFFIQDIRRGKRQAVRIENLELCFD